MPALDQNVNPQRYQIIPRVLVFARRGEELLLLKIVGKGRWAGKFNGLGGHVEAGEDPLSAARRELMEESGLQAELRLVGTLFVETGKSPGIGIFIYTGQAVPGEIHSSAEGEAAWYTPAETKHLPLLEDVPILLAKIAENVPYPFSARSFYDADGCLRVEFA
ncbi:MAG: hypothetical protein AUK01_03110 [Anaerolineae bacterium CG2_30_57_67]|nr:MAG: hypothetical protein AUK01_03110 [Anaerolineae bacterium CG2_30_57_67]